MEDELMAKKIRVFAYGTLKSGHGNNVVFDGGACKYLGRATIAGPYKFVDLGWYPAVVKLENLEGQSIIGGEVYEVDHDTLATCDMIEGHPVYYCREKVMTSLGSKAWVYMLPEPYATRKPVVTPFWEQTPEEEAWCNDAA